MKIISYNLRKLAAIMQFAADLTEENVLSILETIKKIIHDPKNFDFKSKEPLTLKPETLDKLKEISKNFPIYDEDKTLIDILDKFLSSLEIASRENENLRDFQKYMSLHFGNPKKFLKEKTFFESQKILLDKISKFLTGMHALVKS